MILDPIRPYFQAIRIGLAIALPVAIWMHGCAHGARSERNKTAAEIAGLESAIQAYAQATKDAQDRAKSATDKLKESANESDERYADLQSKARKDAAALAAALRSGKQRLSDTWACPAPAGASQAATDAAKARSESVAGSAGRIIAAADADRATIDWLHARWKADRDAVIAAGCAVVE